VLIVVMVDFVPFENPFSFSLLIHPFRLVQQNHKGVFLLLQERKQGCQSVLCQRKTLLLLVLVALKLAILHSIIPIAQMKL
jgi:hypothetical protein